MNSDRMEGAAKSAGAKLEEGLGRATGDVKTVRRQARGLEVTIRENVETRPYTAVAVALALGWLVGRLRRPY